MRPRTNPSRPAIRRDRAWDDTQTPPSSGDNPAGQSRSKENAPALPGRFPVERPRGDPAASYMSDSTGHGGMYPRETLSIFHSLCSSMWVVQMKQTLEPTVLDIAT